MERQKNRQRGCGVRAFVTLPSNWPPDPVTHKHRRGAQPPPPGHVVILDITMEDGVFGRAKEKRQAWINTNQKIRMGGLADLVGVYVKSWETKNNLYLASFLPSPIWPPKNISGNLQLKMAGKVPVNSLKNQSDYPCHLCPISSW